MPKGHYERRGCGRGRGSEAYLTEPLSAVRERMEALVLADIERECEERDWQIKQRRKISQAVLLHRNYLTRCFNHARVFFTDYGKMEMNRKHRYAIPKAE